MASDDTVPNEESSLMRWSNGQRYTDRVNSVPTTLLSNTDSSSPRSRPSLSAGERQSEVVIVRGSSQHGSDVPDTYCCSRECLWHVIKILFGCGVSNGSDRPSEDRNSDGVSTRNSNNSNNNSPYTVYVGPIVLAIVLFSVSCSQEIAIYVSEYPKIVMHLFNSAYIIVSIVILIVMICAKTGRPSDDYIERGRPSEMLFAMWIFWGFGVILDIAETYCIAACARELIDHDHKDTKTLVIHGFYHVIRPLFKLILVIFCTYHHTMKAIFDDTVRYGLMIILATMFSIWFELLFDEAKYKFHKNDKFNGTIEYNMSTAYLDCYGNNPESFGNVKWIRSICVPGMIEFTLLIVECIIHWFMRCKPKTENTLLSEISNESVQNLQETISHPTIEEMVPANSHVGSFVSQNSHASESSADTSINLIRNRRNASNIVYMLSYSLNISLSVIFAVFAFYSDQFGPVGKFATFFCMYSVVWYVCNFSVWRSTIGISRDFKPKHGIYKGLNGLEHLLLLALLGPLLKHCFAIITVIHEWDCVNIVNPVIKLIREIFNTIQILIQVPLIFLVKRITTEPVERKKSLVTAERDDTNIAVVDLQSRTDSERDIESASASRTEVQTYPNSDDVIKFRSDSQTAAELHPGLNASAQLSPDLKIADQLSPDLEIADQLSPDLEIADQLSPDLEITDKLSPDLEMADQLSPDLNAAGQPFSSCLDAANQSHPDLERQSNCSMHYSNRIGKFILLVGIFHLAANNAAYWYVDTFIYSQESQTGCNASDSQNSERMTTSQSEPSYFDPAYWPVISGVVEPLHIFYRFHSMLLLIGAWLSFVFPKKKRDE